MHGGRALRAALGLAGALACACASARAPRLCDGTRLPLGRALERRLALDAWRRANVAGIAVYTDAEPAAADRVVRDLERFVEVVSQLVFQDGFVPRAPASLFLFRDPEQYVLFGSCFSAGHTLAQEGALRVGLPLGSLDRAVLQHETVHLLLYNASGRADMPWFHEGLAEVLSETVIRSDLALIPARPLGRAGTLRVTDPLPLARLLSSGLAVQPTLLDTERYYADAWAWVHYALFSEAMGGPKRAPALLAYAAAVGRGEAWDEAFAPAFGEPLEAIEREYLRHRRRLFEASLHPQVILQLEGPATAVAFEPLSAPEIAAQLAFYALDLGPEHAPLAVELFDSVLRPRPDDAVARIGAIRATAMQEDFERAEALWSDLDASERETEAAREARAELAAVRYAALDEGERREAGALLARAREGYERLLREAPERRSLLLGLGETYRLEPEPADVARGIAVLEAAVALDPLGPQPRLALGDLYRRAGDAERARLHLHYVAEAYADWPLGREAGELLERLPK